MKNRRSWIILIEVLILVVAVSSMVMWVKRNYPPASLLEQVDSNTARITALEELYATRQPTGKPRDDMEGDGDTPDPPDDNPGGPVGRTGQPEGGDG